MRSFMRSFRRLPPFLRAVLAGGVGCSLATVSLMAAFYFLNQSASPEAFMLNFRLFWVAINLIPLSMACVFYGLMYVMVNISRMRQPAGRWQISFDSWRSQALTFAVMVGPALCNLLLVLVTTLLPTVVVDPNVENWSLMAACGWPFFVMALLVRV